MEISDEIIRATIKKRRLLHIGSEVNYAGAVKFICSQIQNLPPYSSPSIIAIIGGAAAGKSTLSLEIKNTCYPQSIIISTDDFLIGTRDYRNLHFDKTSPLAKYDFQLLRTKIEGLKKLGQKDHISLPVYDDSTGSAIPVDNKVDSDLYRTRDVSGVVSLIVIEGDFLPECKLDLLIYLHMPDGIRLQNRIQRDMEKRGYIDSSEVEKNFMIRQQKQHLPYTLPVAEKANIILLGKKSIPENYCFFDLYQEEVPGEEQSV
jgi:uridine kinase